MAAPVPKALADMRAAYDNRAVGHKRAETVTALRKWLMEFPKDFMAEFRRMEGEYLERVKENRARKAERAPAAAEGDELLPEEPIEGLIQELLAKLREKPQGGA
jgi:phage regulator Rha-like protein